MHTSPVTESTATYPAESTAALGPLILAFRLYTGVGQRTMARKLNMDRRRYQRIEAGQVPCPPGFLTRMAALVAEFDDAVDVFVAAVDTSEQIPVPVPIESGFNSEWERQIAYRAAVETCYRTGDTRMTFPPRITLTLVG